MAPIQMGCINIRGINRKFNHLKYFLAQDKISILAISETHTVKSIVVPKFHCYQRNSEINPTRSGGVALLVAQNLASTPHTRVVPSQITSSQQKTSSRSCTPIAA
jgi:hypothetical protein